MSRPSPRRKAAIAVVAMGAEQAATLISHLDPTSVAVLAAEIDALGQVSTDELMSVLGELTSGELSATNLPAPGRDFTRELVVKALGPERSASVLAELDRPKPFSWLEPGDPELVAPVLAGEPPAAIALALAHVSPVQGAALLTRLPDDLRNDVAHRIASLGQVLPETVREVEDVMHARLADSLSVVVQRFVGPNVLADVLSRVDRQYERSVLTSLARKAPDLAEATRASLFTFDDAMSLESRSMQTLLKGVEAKDLAVALVNADDTIKERVLANMSERARLNLEEEMDLVNRATPAEINAARKAVVAAARRLEEEGVLDLSRRDDAA